MSKKLISVFSIVTIAVMLLSASVVSPSAARSVTDLHIFNGTKFDAHYRVPNEASIEQMLKQSFIALPNASPQVKAAAVQSFLSEFNARNPDVPNPKKLASLLAAERSGLKVGANSISVTKVDRSIKSLVTLVEFSETAKTWDANVFDADGECDGTAPVTFAGPLHGQMDPPGPRDNNTIYYNNTGPDLYEEIYFGTKGVTANHPNLGNIFFKGKTMVNYYLEQSGGKFAPSGEVVPQWFQAQYPEAWYGEDGCNGDHNIRAEDLVLEVIAQLDATGVKWQDFDASGIYPDRNPDGVVDNFTVIHAGAGQESGGGEQGDFSIWSHASMVNWPDGILVCTKGETACPDRDIYVADYSMDPEMVDLGVISEEFGHAAFGLPDIYTTDAQGSPSNWAIMESGSWNGQLGGMEPAPFPLWFREVIGWANMKTIDYDDATQMTKVGQLSATPKGMLEGMRINLPDKEVTVDNLAGTDKGLWSGKQDATSATVSHAVDLTGTTAPVLSFSSSWDLEEDFDYGFVEVSTDAGLTWTALDDTGTVFVQNSLTGTGDGVLSFDLTPYAGQSILFRLRYTTDPAVHQQGWFIDNLTVVDGQTTILTEDFEGALTGWTLDGWTVVPFTEQYPRYYLVEWRNNSGYDQGLKWPYATVYSDATQWEVDRGPYTVPGMLLWLRDGSYDFDYTLNDATFDIPSYAPKHALLVVDSHYWPYEWDNWIYSGSGAHLRVNSRLQPGNATFTTQPTTPFSLRLGYDPFTGIYQDEPLDQQSFGPQPAVSQFHDSLGYFPGVWYNWEADSLYFWDRVASVAIPAKEDYTTKATWMDKTPATFIFGGPYGTGNPGDTKTVDNPNGVQYGLHIAVTGKGKGGTYGLIRTWNAMALTSAAITTKPAMPVVGGTTMVTVKVKNESPVAQKVVVDIPIPAKTTYGGGSYYRGYTNSIHWEGTMAAKASRSLVFKLKVSALPFMIVANVKDGAVGSTATLVVGAP